jgi:hypothetical protein
MNITKILVKICCNQPSWVKNYPKLSPPIYRLYIDNDLLTERLLKYSNTTAVYEEIHADLKTNIEYTLRIEPIITNPAQAKFKIDDFTSAYLSIITSTDHAVTFKLN